MKWSVLQISLNLISYLEVGQNPKYFLYHLLSFLIFNLNAGSIDKKTQILKVVSDFWNDCQNENEKL